MKFSQLVETLSALSGCSFLFNFAHDPEISGVAAVDQATSGSISYIEGGKFAAQVKTTNASALILPKDPALQQSASDRQIAWIEATVPRLMFAQTIALFYQPFQPAAAIHPTAVIDPGTAIGQNVAIGAHVVIQPGVKLGDGVCIHPNVVIYPDVQIGDRTLLHANCVIQERSQIGADCVIHSGAVIGAEGFGFVPVRDGWYKMQQSGYVVLENGVEIGCNSAVDRPAVGETRIAQNTKLDNLVHIGHGCQIGRNGAIAAQTGLAGGVEIGDRVMLAGQVGISNNVKIGDGVIASAKTGLHQSVAAGQLVSGYPGIDHKSFLKVSALYDRIPEMYQAIRDLRKRLDKQKAD
jgi:UDP-3-O-[3-hydroxymyristoyl] glucosamine N-acyltransferase